MPIGHHSDDALPHGQGVRTHLVQRLDQSRLTSRLDDSHELSSGLCRPDDFIYRVQHLRQLSGGQMSVRHSDYRSILRSICDSYAGVRTVSLLYLDGPAVDGASSTQ